MYRACLPITRTRAAIHTHTHTHTHTRTSSGVVLESTTASGALSDEAGTTVSGKPARIVKMAPPQWVVFVAAACVAACSEVGTSSTAAAALRQDSSPRRGGAALPLERSSIPPTPEQRTRA
jgi:hypothetical protein